MKRIILFLILLTYYQAAYAQSVFQGLESSGSDSRNYTSNITPYNLNTDTDLWTRYTSNIAETNEIYSGATTADYAEEFTKTVRGEDEYSNTLSAGDIAFVGYHTDSDDGFTFIALTDIPGGEVIYFTDKGWNATNATWYLNSEDHITWTAPAGGVSIGTVISIIETSGDSFTVTHGTAFLSGSGFSLLGGDSILAYQSSSGVEPANPTFIAGIYGDDNYVHTVGCDDAGGWLSCSTCTHISGSCSTASGDTSGMPAGLTNGENALALFPNKGEEDNAKYTGTLTGTVSVVRAAIHNPANWTTNQSPINIAANQYSGINITPDVSNNAPTASAFTANPSGNLTYTFSTNDFGYNDSDSDALDHVLIEAVPTNGTLYLDANSNDTFDAGEAVTVAQQVTKADLDAGNLQYIQNGNTNTSFQFEVNDGKADSSGDYVATLNMISHSVVNWAGGSNANAATTGQDGVAAIALGEFRLDAGASVPYTEYDDFNYFANFPPDGLDLAYSNSLVNTSAPNAGYSFAETSGAEFSLDSWVFFSTTDRTPGDDFRMIGLRNGVEVVRSDFQLGDIDNMQYVTMTRDTHYSGSEWQNVDEVYLVHLGTNPNDAQNKGQVKFMIGDVTVSAAVAPTPPIIEVGTENTASSSNAVTPQSNFFEDSRREYLITASDLGALGLKNGDKLYSLAFKYTSVNPVTSNVTISLKSTTQTEFSSFSFEGGGTQVFSGTHTPSVGWATIVFDTPYTYDGNGIVVSYCYDNNSFSGNSTVEYSVTTYSSNRYAYTDGASGCSLSSFGVNSNRPNMQFATVPPNNAPTDISLTATSINQSVTGVNTTVGTLSTTDADGGDTHTYSLVAGTGDDDNASFNISGTTLRTGSALAAGTYDIRINTNDGTDDFAEEFTITVVDNVAPSAPSTPDLATSSDSGNEEHTAGSTSDNLTNDTTPTFEGTAEAGATVKIISNVDGEVGSGIATGGNYSITTSALTAGAHTITATATDGSANTSSASSALSITIDTTSPTVSISTTSSNPTNDNPIPVTITFNSEADNMTENDITVVNGTTSNFVSPDSTSFYVDITPSGNGGVQVSLGAGTAFDRAGNANTVSNTLSLTFDGTAPAFSSVSPSSSSSVSNANVGYTLSEAIASGTVTFTRTSGTADGNSPHVVNLTGSELNAGTFSARALTNAPSLVSGATYTISFDATDVAGNSATTVSSTGVTFDNIAPTITSITAPVNGAYNSGKNLQFTVAFSESVSYDDGNSCEPPYLQINVGGAIKVATYSSGNGTASWTFTYSVGSNDSDDDGIAISSFSLGDLGVQDVAGNALNTTLPTLPNTSAIIIDNTDPVISSVSPSSSSMISNANVGYALSETIASGTVTFTRTSGTADGSSPHVISLTGNELNSGTFSLGALTNAPSLVSGATYTISFDATDAAGNSASTVSSTGVTFDNTAPVISSVSPSSNSAVTNVNVRYTLSEAIASGTVTFTRTSGTADRNSPHVVSLTGSELNAGTFSVGALTNAPTLVDGSVYTISFDGVDGAGNAATTVNSTEVTYDVTLPTITSITAPANGSYNAGKDLTFTVTFSEAVTYSQIGSCFPPSLRIDVGGSIKAATYVSGDGTDSWTFTYSVGSNDSDSDGIVISSIDVGDLGIKDEAGNVLNTTLPTLPNTSAILVDNAAPTISTLSPADNTTGVSLDGDFVLTFNEAVVANTGNVTVHRVSDDGVVRTFDVTNNAIVSVSGSVVTLDNTSDLALNTEHYILVDNGAFEDVAGNSFAGISSIATWSFTTIEQTKMSIDDPSIAEGESDSKSLTFTVSLSQPAPAGGATVDYATSDGTASSASDYTATSGTVSFVEGESSKTITVTVSDDAVVEDDETLTVGLTNPAGANVVIDDATGVGTITNDDQATVTIADVTVAEADGTATVTFTLDNAVEGGLSVDVSTTNGTATGGVDFSPITAQTITFDGTAGETETLDITITADAIVEADETITVSMSGLTPATAASTDIDITDGATVTITNDDVAVITIADVTISEDAGTGTATLTLDKAVAATFDVYVNSAAGTAGHNDDFTEVFNEIASFAGTAGETQTINFTVLDDDVVELDETFRLLLSSVTNTSLNHDDFNLTDEATVTIKNDDAATLAIDDVDKAENADGTTATLTFTVTLTGDVDQGMTVDFATSDGTALSASDYTSGSGTLNFAGTDGETQTLSVAVSDDDLVEADETFDVTLSNLLAGGRNVSISDATGVGTITNDDLASITIADVTVDEEDGTATVSLVLNKAVEGGLTVDLSTADGTATTTDSDYTALVSSPVTFAGTIGESHDVNITIGSDSKLEANETFTVSMSNLTPVTVSSTDIDITDGATVTINNDDQATVTIADASGAEADGAITLTATLDNAVDGGFFVELNTADVTALSTSDYTALISQKLTFSGTAGEQQTFTITPTDDSIEESTETLTVSMSNISAGTVDKNNIDITDGATVTITDEDDNTAPVGYSVTLDDALIGSAETAISTFTFTGAEIGTTYNYTVSSDNGGTKVAGSGTIATATDQVTLTDLSGLNDGTLTLSVTLTDASSNVGTVVTAQATIDQTMEATLSPADDAIDVLPDAKLSMDFGENVYKGTGNITIAQSSNDEVLETIDVTSSNVVVNGSEVIITPTNLLLPPSTEFYVSIEIGALTDDAGNNYAGATSKTAWTFTTIAAPVVTATTVPTADTYAIGDKLSFETSFTLPVTITGTPSLPITIGTETKAATLSGIVSESNTATFTYTITEGDLDTDGITVGSTIDLNGATIVDEFGTDAILTLNNTASTANVNVDGIRATPTITSVVSDLTNAAFTVTVTYDEPVSGLTAEDLNITNGTADNVAVVTAGLVWTADITPTADGAITVAVAAAAVTDAAGNTSVASAAEIATTFDGTAPAITSIARVESERVNTGVDKLNFTVKFSENVTGVDASDFQVATTGTATASVNTVTQVDGKTYTVNVNGISGEGTIGLNAKDDDSIIDAATNALASAFTGEVYTTNFVATDIALSTASIQENNAVGAEIGAFSTTDADAGDSHTYTLVSGTGDADNASFTITGNKLLAAEVFDFETKNNYSIRVKTDDSFGGTYEEVFTIEVINEAEAVIVVTGEGTFDETILGLSATKSWTIENRGEAATEVRIISSSQGFSVNPGSVQLNPGDTKNISAVFTPTEAKVYNGVVVFNYDITNNIQDNVLEIGLSGEGVIVTGLDNGQISEEQIGVFPNPASTYVTIDLSELSGMPLNIQMISPTGVSRLEKEGYDKSELTIDVTNFESGLYIIQFSNERSLVRKKVLIRK